MSASRIPTRAPLSRERSGEVRGQRRLADAALAGGDRDHAGRRVELDRLVRLGPAASELRRQRSALVRAHDVELEPDGCDALDGADLARDLLLERVPERAARNGERDRHGHVAAVDRDLADHVEIGDRLAQLRVDDVRERGEYRVFRRCHG